MASNKSDAVSKYNLLAEPDMCGICLEVAEEPRQHEKCGKLLCSECLEKYGRNKPCPNCREENPQYFEDKKGKREIKALPIKCSNADKKCKWEGTVDKLKQHVEECPCALVPCPKQCKDAHGEVEQVVRKKLNKHLRKVCTNRDYTCQYCGKGGTYATILEHENTCKKKVLPCSNAGCSKTMERQQVDEHIRTQCPHTVVLCKYKGIGCTSELKRIDMAAHEKEDHLHMAVNTLQEAFREQCQKLKNKEAHTFAVPEYQMRKETGAKFTSPSFYTHPNGYHVAVTVEIKTILGLAGVFVSARMLKGEYDDRLKWPFSGKITITLLNQLEDKNHYTDTIPLADECDEKRFTSHPKLAHDPVENTQYLVDDTLYFRVSVDIPVRKPWLECTLHPQQMKR